MTRPNLVLDNLSVAWRDDRYAMVRMDMPGKSANIINDALQDDLERVLDLLVSEPEVAGAVLYSGKDRIFVAGADLTAIVRTLDWPDEAIHQFCQRGQKLFNRWQECPFPTIAAIHGACVGGGLELALGCSLLIASDDNKTLIGLPETKLGLIPGWAGTVRLPRLLGLKKGIELIAFSELFGPSEALKLGLIDEVAPREQLLERALALLQQPDVRQRARDRYQQQHQPCRETLDQRLELSHYWSEWVGQPGGIHPYAPKVLAQHMLESADLPFEEACQSEARAMAKVYGCDSSRGLLNNFFLNEHSRKNPGWVAPAVGTCPPIQTVGLVGAGVMGQAIAKALLAAKGTVRIHDAQPGVAESFAASQPSANLTVASTLADLFPCDLVIECVTENLKLKQNLFGELEQLAGPDTLLATNTSAISLSEIFSECHTLERTLGVHFCHPQLMQLVEIIRHEPTSEATVRRGVDWLKSLRKVPLVVRNAPGFVVNRLLTALIDAAIALFEAGVPLLKIDQALEDFGFLGGPFKIMDTIGIDTVVHAGRAISAQGILQVSGSPILPMLARRKRLGRKSGSGFYRYVDDEPQPDESALELLAPYQKSTASLDSNSIQHRVFGNILLAAGELLDRQVVANPRDIDLALIQGLGFPAHAGGLLFWADQQRREELADSLIWNLKRHPNLCLAKTLADWQSEGKPFYNTLDA